MLDMYLIKKNTMWFKSYEHFTNCYVIKTVKTEEGNFIARPRYALTILPGKIMHATSHTFSSTLCTKNIDITVSKTIPTLLFLTIFFIGFYFAVHF